MLKEYDVVNAIRDISDIVRKGSKGTVLIIYPSIPPQYEVEFMDEEGNTLDVLTVHEKDIEQISTDKSKKSLIDGIDVWNVKLICII